MILITGTTDSIGLKTAKQLARQGYKLMLHGRNEEKALRARDAVLHTALPDVAPKWSPSYSSSAANACPLSVE
ncbi:MAG: SDR family NAD(P)-dependent oxidoreductase [Gallionella sp.]